MEVVRFDKATLYLGDCLEVLPETGAVAVIVTDPPYGIGYRSGYATKELWAHDSIVSDESTQVRDAVLTALQDTPALVFGSWKAPRPAGTRMVLTWDKGGALGMGALDLPWKPDSEEIYVIGKGFVGRRDEGSVLRCPPVQSMAKNGRVHPTQKPVPLLMRLLQKCPPGSVIDPFMGSGSTGVACCRLGREFVGIEVDKKYFEIACERIADAEAQGELFASGDGDPTGQAEAFDWGERCERNQAEAG